MSSALERISAEEYQILSENQCPLPPRKYRYTNDEGRECTINATAWYYKEKFWIKELETNRIYPVNLPPKELNKYKLRINQMRTVDEYISGFGLTTSVQIYQMLTQAINRDALSPNTTAALGKSAGLTNASLYAKKFNPTWWNRFGFFGVVLRAMLNAYFIVTNFITIYDVPSNFQIFVFIVVSIEALLWIIAFSRTMYNVYSLLKRMCIGSTTHFQVKNIPENLRQLGSLSVMRYLPNGEQMVMFRKRGIEWFAEKKAQYKFEVNNSYKFKYLVILRWFILTILDIIGPFVAVFSLLFKMAQLNFQFDALHKWQWFEIVGYFAFVNQVAGIRKVRKIEIDALEHFIFSGSDIKLSEEEVLLLDAWWNYTIVSCVANICDEFKFPVYDSIIFWYNLNVRRIQLLFKDHQGFEGKDFIGKSGKKLKIDFKKYDTKIEEEMNKNKKKPKDQLEVQINNNNMIETKTNSISEDDSDDEQNYQVLNAPKKVINNNNTNDDENNYVNVDVTDKDNQND